jgi:uncharacterized protein (TIGR04255 family)
VASHVDPLVAPPVPEIPLRHAPLVRVIAQVRFPLLLRVEQRDFVAPFQEAIRADYPVLQPEQIQTLLVASDGTTSTQRQTAWRFEDVARRWRVSLASEFLALDTTAYTSRSEFFTRLRDVVVALDQHVGPKLVDRLGVRYIDRISGDALREIETLVRPEVRGIAGTGVSARALHTLTESMFALEGARLVTRWGLMPADATVDPAAIEPISEESWILDIDMFSAEAFPFGVERILSDAGHFAERIYNVFRWVVTEDFLRRYGGNP